jgi:hypothetical protein
MYTEARRELSSRTIELESSVRDLEGALVEQEATFKAHLRKAQAEAVRSAQAARSEAVAPLKSEVERLKVSSGLTRSPFFKKMLYKWYGRQYLRPIYTIFGFYKLLIFCVT